MGILIDQIRSHPRKLAAYGIIGYCILFLIGMKRSLYYTIAFTMGVLACFIIISYYILIYNVPQETTRISSKHFKFLNKKEWDEEISKLSVPTEELNEPIFKESFLISETLDDFINLILQEFIDSWYSKIIKDTLFQDSIRLELKYVFQQLQKRLSGVDFSKFLVSKLVPIINDHLTDYLRAEESVRAKINNNKGGMDQIDHDIDVARQYRRGKIHQAVTITKTEVNDVNEKKYLRNQISQILVLLLSDKENTNEIGISLVREILSCTILTNIFQMLGEGDFYNLLIIKLISDNLKRRDQVKKLRAALDEHTKKQEDQKQNELHDNFHGEKKSKTNLNKEFIITENMDVISYNNCLEKINNISSIDELKQLRVYLSLQSANLQHGENFTSRIKEVQILVENKIKVLEAAEIIDLKTILSNKEYLIEFRNFLKNKRNLNILEFWLSVEKLKAPLTLDNDENKLSLSLGFSNSDEIRDIYNKILKTLDVKKDLTLVEKFINSTDLAGKNELYQKVRNILFELQDEVFQQLEVEFKYFSNTNEYNDLKVKIPKQEKLNEQPVSHEVIQAVEDAFTQIMKNNDNKPYEPERKLSTIDLKKDLFGDQTSTLFSNDNRSSKLFDDLSDESGTDSESLYLDNNNLQNSMELENSDSNIDPEQSEINNDQEIEQDQQSLVLAAPGNLKLIEEIDKLNNEINRLSDQQTILLPLIKKAEVTNNLSELKILKNSKASLEREINIKELQKQQYIVQENDNSLFGKSRVGIQGYISSNENNKEFILYIIEVQRFSNDDPNTNTAGWIIARRYSQFYKLHDYLKEKYFQVSNLKFPKRTMFKLQQRQILEMRKLGLEDYLKELIKIPEVCSDKVFRSFLSSENFNLRKNSDFRDVDSSNTKKNIESLTNIFNGFSNRNKVGSKPDKVNYGEFNNQINENLKDMERELKSFDEKEIFIKPIIDTLITIFKLKNSKNWLRGRALIVILQQIFGTTIEKKIYDQINQLTQDENILDMVILLKNIVFPNGKFKDPPIIRSNYEKSITKDEALIFFTNIMNDTFNTIFGVSNTKFASRLLFNILQNDFLLKHLIFEIFDELVNELFPELSPNRHGT